MIKTRQSFVYALLKYALALVLLLATQALFAIVNHRLFNVADKEIFSIIIGNLHYGTAITAIMLSPFLILMSIPVSLRYNKYYLSTANCLAGIGVILMLAANMIDIPYYQWTSRRMTGEIFNYLGQNFEGGWKDLITIFLKDFWYYFLIYFFLLFLWFLGSSRIHLVAKNQEIKNKKTAIFKEIGIGIVMLLLTLTLARGGWIHQYRPLSPIDAGRYAGQSNTALIVNTPFSIMHTIGNTTSLKKLDYFDEEELERIFSPISLPDTAVFQACHKNMNVVLIILESFSEEYMGCINQGGESFTPFLDSLSDYCQIYRGRANGKRSIESLPAILLGIPSLMDEAYITSPYSLNKTSSLPDILKPYGYQSAFFHGAYNGSMNFNGFAQMIGIDNYYGMNEYDHPDDFDGTWGIFDEPFLQYSVQKMSTMRQPFFSTIYTISSHHPYTIPPQHKGKFKKGKIPLLETIGYADYALKRFFESASKTSWYSNTLFIITADHTAQALSDFYRSDNGQYNIPMLWFRPNDTAFYSDKIFQHIDIMPTLLDYLNIAEPCFSFGKSIYTSAERYHIAYNNNYYQLTAGQWLILFNGTNFEVFDLSADPLATKNIEQETLDNLDIQHYKNLLKAIIEQYNNRMIDNKLTIE